MTFYLIRFVSDILSCEKMKVLFFVLFSVVLGSGDLGCHSNIWSIGDCTSLYVVDSFGLLKRLFLVRNAVHINPELLQWYREGYEICLIIRHL